MTFLGIELRRPSFNEITAATVMAVGLWVAVIGLARASGHALQAHDAGAILVVAVWGCIGARLGFGIAKGGPPPGGALRRQRGAFSALIKARLVLAA
jgi:hypothetical protein